MLGHEILLACCIDRGLRRREGFLLNGCMATVVLTSGVNLKCIQLIG